MMCLKVTFILLFCVFQAYSTNINESEQYAPHISAILNYLNSNPNKIYDYQKGTFVNSQQKADIVELTIDVDVTCTGRYPEVPCIKQVLTCNGFLKYGEGSYRVLSEVLCNPKQDYSIESSDALLSTIPTVPPPESKIELSHESVSSDQIADFVAVKADTLPCVGCPFDLHTNVDGVSSLIDTALKHIETERSQKHVAINVIRLQQQVVAGVKYILTIEVAPTVCQKDVAFDLTNCPLDSNLANSVCEIVFLQRPWISKEKIIIRNNCTVSQEYPPENKQNKRNEMSNEINTYINKPKEMNPQSLADLESQILVVDPENTKPVTKSNIESNLYPKKVQYEVVENPSNKQFTSYVVPNTIKSEPLLVTQRQSINSYSTPLFAYQNTFDGVLYTEQPKISEKNVNNDNLIPNSINSQTAGLEQNMNVPSVEVKINADEVEFEGGRPKRENEDLPINEKFKRLRRELNSPGGDTSESIDKTEEDGTHESLRSKRNIESHSSNIRIKRRDHFISQSPEPKEDTDNFISQSPERKGNTKNFNSQSRERKDGTKNFISQSRERNHDRKNSVSQSDERDDDTKVIRPKINIDLSSIVRGIIHGRGKDSSSGSSESGSSGSGSSGSSSGSSGSSSSSGSSGSSSGSSESRRKRKHHKHDSSSDDSDSSSSNGSSDEKSYKRRKHHKHHNSDDSNSSSRKSSERKSSRENEISRNADDDGSVYIKRRRIKRSIGQLEKITQEEKFLVRDLADFAAFSLDSMDDDDNKRVILQIVSAKKLKLDGIYYHMILRLGISQCSETEDDETCRDKLLPNLTKICKVLVHVEDDLSNPKVVKSQCQSIKKDDRDRNRTNYSRYRRDLLVGAPSDISVDDSRILEFTRDTLTELDSQSEHPTKHKVVKIASATSQVVAGAKYTIRVIISLSDCAKSDTKPLEECDILQNSTIKTCDIEVWDRPWLDRRETTVKCDDTNQELHFVKGKERRKRSFSTKKFDKDDLAHEDNINVLGGIEDQSPDNQKAANYLKDILSYLDNESGHSNKLKIQDVLSVEKQVVAGVLWRIKARITLSDCQQTEEVDPQLCKNLEGSESRTCVFKIWDRPWLPNGKEVQTICENESKPYNFRLKRSLGSSRYIIPSSLNNDQEPNPKVLRYIKNGLQYLDSRSSHDTKYVLRKIKNMSKKTVAGILWNVTAEIILSDCLKQYNIQYCEELEDTESKTCNFIIWEQPWLANTMQINITCENDGNLYSFSPKSNGYVPNPHPEELLTKFNDFIVKHNKNYVNDIEFNYRLKVFRDNLNTIKLLNKYEQGTARYGVTQFADLTENEFSRSHGLRPDLRSENEVPFSNAVIPDIELPTEFDWRNKNAVTEVKNQGSCGSCWAFSTTGNVEGQYAIKYGKLLEFSEQELVDCDKLDEGCNGGLMDNAYRTIEKIGGLETESDYPYDAENEKCHFNKSKVSVQLSGALNISHNEDDMAKWLVKNGPISIAINANAMQFYMGGVSHPWKVLCSPKNLDHGVLIVGFGVHHYPLFNRTLPFWTIKNSWGPSWGEQGYYRVYRGDGTCGLNQTPSSAIVA